eukprot:c46214_g1_i1 orf=86-271(+)
MEKLLVFAVGKSFVLLLKKIISPVFSFTQYHSLSKPSQNCPSKTHLMQQCIAFQYQKLPQT